jgi:hypothetical protein
MDSDGNSTSALEPGLHVTNSHFNQNGKQYGYGIRSEGAIDINISSCLFYSGHDISSNPGSAVYKGGIFLLQSERFNIIGNLFQSIGHTYTHSNYHNTAISIGGQTNTTIAVYAGLIQSNIFTGFKGPAKAIWLQSNSQKIQAIERLNIFNDCSTNIMNQGTNNITKFASAAHDATGIRQITASTSAPSGGSSGDVWIKY